jgi:hypothetical protein
MTYLRIFTLAILAAGCLATSAIGGHGGDCCANCGHKVCVAVPAPIKTKQHCFEVTCKDVCIPAVKGPRVPCCEPPACGRVRTVKVLKKIEYECEHCGYKWHIQAACECGK